MITNQRETIPIFFNYDLLQWLIIPKSTFQINQLNYRKTSGVKGFSDYKQNEPDKNEDKVTWFTGGEQRFG